VTALVMAIEKALMIEELLTTSEFVWLPDRGN